MSPTEKRIFAEGPIDRGPEYVAALVFYSLPRYFSKRGFHGRDPVEDNGWKDRFGGVVGVGLQDPTKRFITGFSFEVAAGVNVLGVWDWAEDNTLRGVSEGDVFTGTVKEIPCAKRVAPEVRLRCVVGPCLRRDGLQAVSPRATSTPRDDGSMYAACSNSVYRNSFGTGLLSAVFRLFGETHDSTNGQRSDRRLRRCDSLCRRDGGLAEPLCILIHLR